MVFEFPIEIVQIIRAFSRPCFRYGIPYKRVLHELHRDEWPELKAKLVGDQADEVAALLRTYNEAANYCEWITGISPIEHYNETTEEFIDSYQEQRQAEIRQRQCFAALLGGIYEKPEDGGHDMRWYLDDHPF